MKIKQIREKSTNELNEMLSELKIEKIKSFRQSYGAQQGTKTSKHRDTKRMIARIKTILKERESGQEYES